MSGEGAVDGGVRKGRDERVLEGDRYRDRRAAVLVVEHGRNVQGAPIAMVMCGTHWRRVSCCC